MKSISGRKFKIMEMPFVEVSLSSTEIKAFGRTMKNLRNNEQDGV